MSELTQERLKELLHYDPSTGIFTRIKITHPSHKRHLGTNPGRIDTWGHRQIAVDGKHYAAHRLAWLYMTGSWPEGEIDHKDTKPDNNAWQNLRIATRSQQICNQNRKTTNTSGYKGVSWYPRYEKWLSRIGLNGKVKCLGYFETKEEAYEAYKKAAKELHKEFARYV